MRASLISKLFALVTFGCRHCVQTYLPCGASRVKFPVLTSTQVVLHSVLADDEWLPLTNCHSYKLCTDRGNPFDSLQNGPAGRRCLSITPLTPWQAGRPVGRQLINAHTQTSLLGRAAHLRTHIRKSRPRWNSTSPSSSCQVSRDVSCKQKRRVE